jgi:8-oxo-dGTP pyrophosphatase MutT (NUDIX family)
MTSSSPGGAPTTTTPTAEPRPAASLILLRDGAAGPEALMLKRHGLSDAFGEAYVFPGGKLDRADVELDPARFLDEAPASLQVRLAEAATDASTAAGLFVAAIREACEECGVLVASPGAAAHAAAIAERLRGGERLDAALGVAGMCLAVSALVPWSRWITPLSRLQAKRFDSRFFVAHAPEDAIARHDGREATESAWLAPRAALERYWAREIALAPPQVMTLAHLARHASAASVLDEARGRPPFRVQPEVLDEGGPMTLCFPGDAAHSVGERLMPGPTRLAVAKGRYDPEGGFAAFFE